MSGNGNYIVVFKDSASNEQIEACVNEITANGGEVKTRYSDPMKGLSAVLTGGLLTSFQENHKDDIDYIEEDGIVTT